MEQLTEYQRAYAVIDRYKNFILKAWSTATRETRPYHDGHTTKYTGNDGARLGYDEVTETSTIMRYFLPTALKVRGFELPETIKHIRVEELYFTGDMPLLRRTIVLALGSLFPEEIRLSTILNHQGESTEAIAFGNVLEGPKAMQNVFLLHNIVMNTLMPSTDANTASVEE